MFKLLLSLTFLFSSLPPLFAETEPSAIPAFDQLLKSVGQKYPASYIPMPRLARDASQQSAAPDERYWIKVWAANKYERTKILETGVDIIEVAENKISGIAHKNTMPILSEKGYVVENKIPLSSYVTTYLKDFPPEDADYHNYDEMLSLMKSLASANSDITSVYSIGKSVEGREIWNLRINSSAKEDGESDKPGAVFMGEHHAREHISTEVPLLFGAWLLENRNREDVRNYIYSLDIHIIPMVNPDGAEYDVSDGKYKWHRKNMRQNEDGNVGVDLNRNYDFRWGGAGASHYTYSDTYCGPSAFSEPESRAVKNFMKKHRNIKTLVTYHNYSELILYPWGGIYEPVENEKDRKAFEKIAAKMAELTGYRAMQSSDLYVATGDAADWMYGILGTFAFTIELPPSGGWGGTFYIDDEKIPGIVKENTDAAMYLLSVTDNPHEVIGN